MAVSIPMKLPRVPEDVQEILETFGFNSSKLDRGVVLAGGSVRRMLMGEAMFAADYDLFFKDSIFLEDSVTINEVANFLLARDYECINSTEWADSYRKGGITIQLCHINRYNHIEGLFSKFDLTMSQFAYDGQFVYYKEQAFADAVSRTIRRTSAPLYSPASTFSRILRFYSLGYKFSLAGILSFLEESKTFDETDPILTIGGDSQCPE